jgi:putative transposase
MRETRQSGSEGGGTHRFSLPLSGTCQLSGWLVVFKPRLQRLQLLFTKYPVYFLTACAYRRRRILANQEIHQAFITFAQDARGFGITVGRYVMMPDHLHLFAAFWSNSPGLPRWIKGLKGTLSKKLRGLGIHAPYWQKGFFDHVMRSEESYAEKWHYVQENPVRAGLVTKTVDWPYQGEIYPLTVEGL